MAEDSRGDSDPRIELQNPDSSEDAETKAARRELKQSSISDSTPQLDDPADTSTEPGSGILIDRPETRADEDTSEMRDHVSSPKKKRAHDQLDDGSVSVGGEEDSNSVASSASSKDRATRLEPEKKRPRDEDSTDTTKQPKELTQSMADPDKIIPTETSQQPQDPSIAGKILQSTSSDTFAASAFGKLASASSPFANLGGGTEGGSAFGNPGAPRLSSFASKPTPAAPSTVRAQNPASAPKLSFGTGNTSSPFAGLSSGSNGLGGTRTGGFGTNAGAGLSGSGGGAFGAAFSGGKPLSGFGSAGGAKPLTKDKPAKPFGAPDSEGDTDADEEDDDGNDHPDGADRSASPEKELEEKKRLRLQRVEVDDGETGEVPIASVRAKMFIHDKEAGWKERGAGMLKINVPHSAIEFDESGLPVQGSFDAAAMDEEDEEYDDDGSLIPTEPKVPRLLMRQDQTHRILLNTAILPEMNFQEKASLKSVGVLFTAFEGQDARPISVTMRMSAANAKIFLKEVGLIQRELRDNDILA